MSFFNLQKAAEATSTDTLMDFEDEEEGFVEGCFNTEELLTREPLRPENVVFRAHKRPDPNKEGAFVQDCYTNDDLTWFERLDYNWTNAVNLVHDPFSPAEVEELQEAIRRKNPTWKLPDSQTIGIFGTTPTPQIFLANPFGFGTPEHRRFQLDGIMENINRHREIFDDILNLNYQNLTFDELLPIAEALKVNTSIKDLMLSGNLFEDDGARLLADVLRRNGNIQRLILTSNRITDEGVEALAEVLKTNSTLRYLSLANNRISDVGCLQLANAIKLNNLSEIRNGGHNLTLNLSGNFLISIVGIQALVDAIRSTVDPRLTPQIIYEDEHDHNSQELEQAYNEVHSRPITPREYPQVEWSFGGFQQ